MDVSISTAKFTRVKNREISHVIIARATYTFRIARIKSILILLARTGFSNRIKSIIGETIYALSIICACFASRGAMKTRISYFDLTRRAIISFRNALSILFGLYRGTGIYTMDIQVY